VKLGSKRKKKGAERKNLKKIKEKEKKERKVRHECAST